jgi:hypothetical protein
VGSALRLTGSFTVAFWARNDLSEMQGMMGNVVTKHWCQTDDDGSWAAPFALHEEPTNDAIGFNGWPEPTCRFDTFDHGSGLPESPGWTHVALRYDDGASYAWIFLNGEVAWEGSWDNCTTDDSMADLTIGTDHRMQNGSLCGNNHFFQGDIDEVLIYDTVLTNEEIQVLVVPGRGIPAVSEWGLLVMALLGLVAGTIMFRQARHRAFAT